MTRREAITSINSTLAELSDERVRALAELARSWLQPTVFSTLSAADRAELDGAVDGLDIGESVAWETVQAELEAKLKAAGA